MVHINKLVTLIAITVFLILGFTSLAMAQEPKPTSTNSQKAEYVMTDGESSSIITVWLNDDTLAFALEGRSQIAAWRLWSTEHPTFFQVYPEVSYRIEFDRLTSQEMQVALSDVRQLVFDGGFVDNATIGSRVFDLSSLKVDSSIQEEMTGWKSFKTFDYADIGDNEADPVLGKLIQQGFVQSF